MKENVLDRPLTAAEKQLLHHNIRVIVLRSM